MICKDSLQWRVFFSSASVYITIFVDLKLVDDGRGWASFTVQMPGTCVVCTRRSDRDTARVGRLATNRLLLFRIALPDVQVACSIFGPTALLFAQLAPLRCQRARRDLTVQSAQARKTINYKWSMTSSVALVGSRSRQSSKATRTTEESDVVAAHTADLGLRLSTELHTDEHLQPVHHFLFTFFVRRFSAEIPLSSSSTSTFIHFFTFQVSFFFNLEANLDLDRCSSIRVIDKVHSNRSNVLVFRSVLPKQPWSIFLLCNAKQTVLTLFTLSTFPVFVISYCDFFAAP
jgi:hypothetical protein